MALCAPTASAYCRFRPREVQYTLSDFTDVVLFKVQCFNARIRDRLRENIPLQITELTFGLEKLNFGLEKLLPRDGVKGAAGLLP